jgi:hypothetical protein
MAARKLLTHQAILAAIHRHAGIICLVARELGTSRQNIHQRIKTSPELQAAVVEAQDELLDVAEGHVARLIQEGDRAAIIWYLSRKGRSRGYGTTSLRPPEPTEQQLEAIVASLGGSIPAFRRALILLGVSPREIPT